MSVEWSADRYLKFANERTRPAIDLLNAVPSASVHRAVDLGCGPGNSTEILVARYPNAEIQGVDNAPDMIEAARKRLPGTAFSLASIEVWDEPGLWDLIYSNAALQWVGDHQTLLPRLAGKLASGGTLAVQMPDNLMEKTHVLMREIAMKEPFVEKLKTAAAARTELPSADWYYALLKPHCSRVDIWRTTYYHVLSGGVDAIVEWLRGTGLMPFLKPLSDDERAPYLSRYRVALAEFYKPMTDGAVMLPFPRLFIVATR